MRLPWVTSELLRTQAENNNRLTEVTVEQALTISKLSRALEETYDKDEAEDWHLYGVDKLKSENAIVHPIAELSS